MSLIIFIGLVILFTWTYVMNQKTKAPSVNQRGVSCHNCSNHACSHYKEGE